MRLSIEPPFLREQRLVQIYKPPSSRSANAYSIVHSLYCIWLLFWLWFQWLNVVFGCRESSWKNRRNEKKIWSLWISERIVIWVLSETVLGQLLALGPCNPSLGFHFLVVLFLFFSVTKQVLYLFSKVEEDKWKCMPCYYRHIGLYFVYCIDFNSLKIVVQ